MNYKDLPEGLLGRVNPVDVKTYAAATGWQPIDGVNGLVAVYNQPASDIAQIIVPLNPQGDTYARRMAEVVSNLAEWERRPALQVLGDLLLPGADVLTIR